MKIVTLTTFKTKPLRKTHILNDIRLFLSSNRFGNAYISKTVLSFNENNQNN